MIWWQKNRYGSAGTYTEKPTNFKKWEKFKEIFWNIKYTNIHMIVVPERREREKGVDNVSDKIIFSLIYTELTF